MSGRDRRPPARVAVAVVLVFWALAGAAPAAFAGRDALIARWIAVNPQARLPQRAGALVAPPPQLRALAARELSSGYRLAAETAAPAQRNPWWLQTWRWLGDRWTELWRAAFGHARLGRGGAVAIGDVLLVAAIGTIAFAVWRLLSALLFDRARAPLEAFPPRADPGALYAAACARARSGEYAPASCLLFAATVGALAQRGVVPEDRSATVGELRRAVRRRDGALVGPFDAVSAAFVTGAYAELPVDASLWERALGGYLALGDGERA